MPREIRNKDILRWIELLHAKHDAETYITVYVRPIDMVDIQQCMDIRRFTFGEIDELNDIGVTYLHIPILNFTAIEDDKAEPLNMQIALMDRWVKAGGLSAKVFQESIK